MKKLLFAGAAAALALIATASQAAVFFSLPGTYGPVATPDAAVATFSAPGGDAMLTFSLDGYGTLDGNNFWEDIFTLNLNGTDILSGTWNMGGGGANEIFFAPVGSAITSTRFGLGAGGETDISTPLSLVAGLNALTFIYDSPGGAHAGPQGLADEGWGVHRITVESFAVPEPATWALMLGGFGLAGAALRRRRAALAT